MKSRIFAVITIVLTASILFVACEKKYPSRDELPKIKDLIGKLQREVEARNAAGIDSLIIEEAYDKGYSSASILNDVYPDPETSTFYAFAHKEITYEQDKGEVTFDIMADSTDTTGRPAEMTVVKVDDDWYIKRFELK
jgi:hypothetical protein